MLTFKVKAYYTRPALRAKALKAKLFNNLNLSICVGNSLMNIKTLLLR